MRSASTRQVDPASARRIVEEFLTAASSGHTGRLVALLTDDATAISDGAGLTETLLQYDTPHRIAAVDGQVSKSRTREAAGGTPAIHYALVDGAPARLVRLTEAWRQHEPDTPLIAQW